MVQKKLLFFFSVFGCYGGLYIALTDHQIPSSNTVFIAIQLSILIIIGLLIGIFVERSYKSNKNLLLNKDSYGDFVFFKQKIFLLVIFIAVASWFINSGLDLKTRIISLCMSSIVFIVSLAGGIYDQFGPSAGRMLLAGIIPLAGSFIFLKIDTPSEIKSIIWSLAFLYLLCSFLIMNNLQLISKVFKAQDINIKSIRKIRNYNYVLSVILSIVCAVFILFNNVMLFVKNTITQIFKAVYSMLVKFSEWITYDKIYWGMPDPLPDIPREWGESDVPFNVVRLLLVIVVIALIISAIILLFTIIKKKNNGRIKGYTINEEAEYIEESEIIKRSSSFIIKRKFKYTIGGLRNISDAGESIRYLYAFILERMYRKKVNLKVSDTPMEIYTKILQYPCRDRFKEIGFNEFTESYRKVRYGHKKVRINMDIIRIANEYEKAVSLLNNESIK